jgi:hypothetical protein
LIKFSGKKYVMEFFVGNRRIPLVKDENESQIQLFGKSRFGLRGVFTLRLLEFEGHAYILMRVNRIHFWNSHADKTQTLGLGIVAGWVQGGLS